MMTLLLPAKPRREYRHRQRQQSKFHLTSWLCLHRTKSCRFCVVVCSATRSHIRHYQRCAERCFETVCLTLCSGGGGGRGELRTLLQPGSGLLRRVAHLRPREDLRRLRRARVPQGEEHTRREPVRQGMRAGPAGQCEGCEQGPQSVRGVSRAHRV